MKIYSRVEAWEESISIPTYEIGRPEKNPMFLETRVYQGSSGTVYPHPVVEKISDTKTDKIYQAVFLENEYLKIMILPELGGRIQMAYDKLRQRHFVYYNQVIKPALVGLTGPWISGGIEFNWPQHHRPSTFDPIEWSIENHVDGSTTVWVSEVERMFRTKGMAGFRLYPDAAYLEINAKLFNRTPFAQTFLWWANPAVKVNEHYQSVFPPDVNAVFDHGKRAVSEFPIAKSTYYKVDYSAGVDISRYKNIPVPTSYMAIKSKYDFMGGYEHDTKGGLLHVANHHISPGKKQWTWGNGEFGYAWDRNLTDEDGPYVELMTGVFTDNQPDFSWIQPFEERTFTQYFMPYSELGVVKNATKHGMINVEFAGEEIQMKFYVTKKYNAKATLRHRDQILWSEEFTIDPLTPVHKLFSMEIQYRPEDICAVLVESNGTEIVRYQPESTGNKEIPKAAEAVRDPREIENIEELFLTGLHIEQYRHATYRAIDYYEEALRREPSDARNNNALGLWYLKRGKFRKAKQYFVTAVTTLIRRNSNPYDAESIFNCGMTAFMLNDYDQAFELFYKTTWNAAWQDVAFLYLARIEMRRNNIQQALMHVSKSLNRNYVNQTARHLKVCALRKLGRFEDALKLISESIELDRFSVGCLFEKYLVLAETQHLKESVDAKAYLVKLLHGNKETYIEYAFDYAHAGLYVEAILLLEMASSECGSDYPLIEYYTGYFELQQGQKENALSHFKKAEQRRPDYCFPNRIEDVNVLEAAISLNSSGAKAYYYLGNFWYANRQAADAIICWEKSVAIDSDFATVHRNLALAYHNKQHEQIKALTSLKKAFELDPTDARVLMELDQLYKKLNKEHHERLALLEAHLDLTLDRDDLYLERITLCNHLGKHQVAAELLSQRNFHPWEGGEGKVVGQHLIAHIELAKLALADQQYDEAIELLSRAETYPINLGEGKLFGTQENDIHYLKGCAYESMGDVVAATRLFAAAATGSTEPLQAIYYNDQQPDKIFYQGLAWKKLGDNEKADAIFNRLIEFGTTHLHDKIKIDYFAVSLPDLLVFEQDLDQRNTNHCHYLIGLGCMGLNNGRMDEAIENFETVLRHDINHFGARQHLSMARKPMVVN
ncbi:MAG: DUF5107 domain-containing protein [Chryseolinea sp.]